MREILFLLFLFLIGKCASKEDAVLFTEGIKLVSLKETFTNNGDLIRFNDSIYMYHNKGIYLYKIPGEIKKIHNDSLVNSTIGYSYFIYKEGENTGYYKDFRHNGANSIRRMGVDSFLARHTYPNISMMLPKDDNFVGTLKKLDTLVLEYFQPEKPDYTYYDSAFLYFHPSLRFKKYSYNKSLEDSIGLQLIKFKFIFNKNYYPKINLSFPKREWLFYIGAVDKNDIESINKVYNNEIMQLLNN